MTLGEGDMRKCINILQSTHMSIGEVSPTNVYVTTGCPMPHDIEAMLAWLLKEDFAGAFKEVWRLMSDKGLALQDVLTKVRLRRPGTRRSWSPPPISHIRRSPHVLRWARHTLAARGGRHRLTGLVGAPACSSASSWPSSTSRNRSPRSPPTLSLRPSCIPHASLMRPACNSTPSVREHVGV